MQRFSELLDAVVDRTTFELKRVQTPSVTLSEKIIDRRELAWILEKRSRQSLAFDRACRARVIVPDESFNELCMLVSEQCHKFVDPATDSIGHTFPINHDSSLGLSFDANGGMAYKATSRVETFTKSIVMGTAILGSKRVTSLMCDWLHEKPVEYSVRAGLNGAEYEYFAEPLKLMEGVRIYSLPLSTDEFTDHLPLDNSLSLRTYLGRMVLTIDYQGGPALFRPENDQWGATCPHTAVPNADFATVCQALALELDTCVEVAFFWSDFKALRSFALKKKKGMTWSPKQIRFGPRPYTALTITTEEFSGLTTLKPGEGPRSQPDEENLMDTLNALVDATEIRIPTSKWMTSKERYASLTDRFIALRIALESLYLRQNGIGEVSFRLAMYGAWHLGTDFEERKNIQKKLRNAYNLASKAVHRGKVEDNPTNQTVLSDAQDLCRQGILKLLKEGAPNDWNDVILGADDKTDLT